MKIAISSTGKDLNSQVSEIFGRCPYFIIVEVDDKKLGKFKAIENININQTAGVGISAVQMVAEENVTALITGNIGPRALDVLKQFYIQPYKGTGLITKVIKNFVQGKLEEIK